MENYPITYNFSDQQIYFAKFKYNRVESPPLRLEHG